MVSVLHNVTIDCANAYEPARFWSSGTEPPLHPEDRTGDPEIQMLPAQGPMLRVNQVPETTTTKNRVHSVAASRDLTQISRDRQVERFSNLGATVVADHRNPDGSGWVVLADPEGNQFCVLRSQSDRAARQSGHRHSSEHRPPDRPRWPRWAPDDPLHDIRGPQRTARAGVGYPPRTRAGPARVRCRGEDRGCVARTRRSHGR